MLYFNLASFIPLFAMQTYPNRIGEFDLGIYIKISLKYMKYQFATRGGVYLVGHKNGPKNMVFEFIYIYI